MKDLKNWLQIMIKTQNQSVFPCQPENYPLKKWLLFTISKLQKAVIKGLNIEINPGEIIAIIGPTAAGKSTLGKLITGIYNPTVGHVRIDNADIRELLTNYRHK